MSKSLEVIKVNASNPKVWVGLIGVTVVAGVVILAERKRRRSNTKALLHKDFGAFITRFEILPFPQPPPPASKQTLAGLTFSITDIFDVKDHVTGFGNPDWEKTHDATEKTALVVTTLLKNGATCVGKNVMDELALGITGENLHYRTPINPQIRSHVPGGSSSGAAVAVAAELVDFSLGTDTMGGLRVPASFCGILGFRPSHGSISTIGVLPNSQSLDTVGWFARDPSTLHRVGHVLLQLNSVEPKRARQLIFADDVFQISNVPKQKTASIVSNTIKDLSGYEPPKHINLGQYIASNVPSLKGFHDAYAGSQNATSVLKALSSVMISLQRYEFKTNHEEWIKSVKPRLASDISEYVLAAINSIPANIKALYKVRTEMRAAFQSLLKANGILVIPSALDPPLELNLKRGYSTEFRNKAWVLLSIVSMSGCCQATIPLGKHDEYPVSVSLISYHGGDKFLLDTLLDIYLPLQEQVSIVSKFPVLPDTNGNMDASELLKEKGNAAFKGRQWNKAVNYYSEAIKLNGDNATFYGNRAAAYLELGCFREAEEDCNVAISLDKKNVKAYLRRGTARESLLHYRNAIQDFKHALALEPQNRIAALAEKRLRKLIS